jgi:hypothetical protein
VLLRAISLRKNPERVQHVQLGVTPHGFLIKKN